MISISQSHPHKEAPLIDNKLLLIQHRATYTGHPTPPHISFTNPTSTTLSIANLKFAIFALVFSLIHKKIDSTILLPIELDLLTLICSLPTIYIIFAAKALSSLASSSATS